MPSTDPPRRRTTTPVTPIGVGHPLKLPYWDPPSVLRELGTGIHHPISVDSPVIRVGSGQPPDVELHLEHPGVHRHHATLHRSEEALEVVDASGGATLEADPRSPTGFSPRAHIIVNVGDCFALASVIVMSLEHRLAELVPTLEVHLGLRAHQAVDEALEAITRGRPLGTTLVPGASVRPLAEALHRASPRRDYPLTIVEDPPAESAPIDQLCTAGACGLMVIDLRSGRSTAPALIDGLRSRRFHLWPLVVVDAGAAPPDLGDLAWELHWLQPPT